MGNSTRLKLAPMAPKPETVCFTLWPDQMERLKANRSITGQSSSDVARKALDLMWNIKRDAQGNPLPGRKG